MTDALKRIKSKLCTMPVSFLIFFIELAACLVMVAVIDNIGVWDIAVSALLLVIISLIFSYIIAKMLEERLRIWGFFIVAAGILIFFESQYKPYTHSVSAIAMFVIFLISLCLVLHDKYYRIGIVVLSAAGELIDSRYVFMMFLPFVVFDIFVNIKRGSLDDEDKLSEHMKLLGLCFGLQIVIMAVKTVALGQNVLLLLFSNNSRKYPSDYLELFLTAFLLVYLIGIISDVYCRPHLFTLLAVGVTGVSYILQIFTDTGYLYKDIIVGVAAVLTMYDFGSGNRIKPTRGGVKLFLIISICLFYLKHIAEFHLTDIKYGYNDYFVTHYYLDYFHYGFVQRGLIGTIFYMLFGYHIEKSTMYYIADVVYFTALALVIAFLMYFYKKYDYENKSIVGLLIAAFFLSPAIGAYFHKGMVLTLDVYGLLLGVVSIVLFIKRKFMFLVPVLCFIAMLNHQIFVFTVFSTVFMAMLYNSFVREESGRIYDRVILTLTTVLVFGAFIYIQFFSNNNIKIDYEAAIELYKDRSGGYLPGKKILFRDVLFKPLSEHLDISHGRIDLKDVKHMIVSVIYFIPLIALYIYVYYMSYKISRTRIQKMAYVIMALSVFAILPCYILETDYNRWTTSLLWNMLFNILFFTVVPPRGERWYNSIDRKKLYVWLLAIIITLGIYMDLDISVYPW